MKAIKLALIAALLAIPFIVAARGPVIVGSGSVDGKAIAPSTITSTGAITAGGLLTCNAGSSGCESDPQIDTITASKYCVADALGVAIDCATNAPTSIGDGATVATGDVILGGRDVVGNSVKTTDAAPDASSITAGQSAYWGATAGTNSTGGATYIGGGIGARKVAVVAAAIENDTLVIAGIKGGVATSATWTYNAGGIGTCAALTNSQCAVLLVNYCNTNGPALGIASCACADATCTVATVGFIPAMDTTRLLLTASDASQTVTMGTNGGLVLTNSTGVSAAPTQLWDCGGTATRGCLTLGNTSGGVAGGVLVSADIGSFLSSNYSVAPISASYYTDGAGARLDLGTDGKVTVTNAAATAGFALDGTTDAKLLMTGRASATTRKRSRRPTMRQGRSRPRPSTRQTPTTSTSSATTQRAATLPRQSPRRPQRRA
jgi:hypothetical protein